FWNEGPQQVSATATIRGYGVTASMRPSRYLWQPCAGYRAPAGSDAKPLGCPRLLVSTTPGSAPPDGGDGHQAAARFLYETKGTYEIRHQVVWEGTWAFTGPGGAAASGRLTSVRTTASRDYPVSEIRAVLTG
ncbi:MAG: hypothetical protein M3N52_05795, partial [Actinomycetota bacterium]|nr:hypothetical protein [Actinomycetota bacterium]